MGIDTSPLDVEESTEPPICAYTREHNSQHRNHPRDVKDTPDIEKPAHSQPQAPSEDKTRQTTTNRDFEHDLSGPTHHAHTIEPSSLSAILNVGLDHGLSNAEAAARLARDGPNTVKEMEGLSAWKILLRQVSNSLTLV
ncbi:hypothetical protein BJY01DRAFT_185509 [Aspergillus pseudoustus]|uniref:Cation-transporting P-type ATPase N-terminal domain-containing protein n=1 Tax=Aspergillus pseudoustus TaxID=1810923 RepID=A0ABR4JXH2_9EURO